MAHGANPEALLWVAIHSNCGLDGRKLQRVALGDSIAPVKQAERCNEEHATAAIFGEGCCDVARDHTGAGEDLEMAVCIALDAVLGGDPERTGSVLVDHANAL